MTDNDRKWRRGIPEGKQRQIGGKGKRWQLDIGCPSCGGDLVEDWHHDPDRKSLECVRCGESFFAMSGMPAAPNPNPINGWPRGL